MRWQGRDVSAKSPHLEPLRIVIGHTLFGLVSQNVDLHDGCVGLGVTVTSLEHRGCDVSHDCCMAA